MTPQPCLIRGTLYPSQRAAAQALGVHPQTICNALNRGTQDGVGLTKAAGLPPCRRRACFLNGRHWPSISAAARGIGVLPSSITKALDSGRTHVREQGGRTA